MGDGEGDAAAFTGEDETLRQLAVAGGGEGLGLAAQVGGDGGTKTGRDIMVLLITIPFWTNLLVRNYAWLIILRQDG